MTSSRSRCPDEVIEVRKKAFSNYIYEGARPCEAQEWADAISTEGELNAVFEGKAEDDEEEMSREDAKAYRGIAARLNYLSPDRMDIGYAVKEAARGPWPGIGRSSRG